MDIRSFFSPGIKSNSSSGEDVVKSNKSKKKSDAKEEERRKKKSSKKRTLDSDSDEDPLPQKLRKTTSSKPKVIRDSDENDDDLVVVSVKKKVKEDSRKPRKDAKQKVEAPSKQKLQPTNADDFFGSTPISQKQKSTIARKKKEAKEIKEKEKVDDMLCNDIDIFDDNDDDGFEKSLLDLETVPSEQTKKEKECSKNSDTKKQKYLEESPIPTKEKKRKSNEKAMEKTPVKKMSPVSEKPVQKKTPESGKKTENLKKDESTPTSEKKKSSYAAFRAREGPRELGAKEIPQGQENCLEGLTFVITGILESVEREQASDLIKRHGGKVTSAVSKKTNYVIVGRDAGESKMEKARKFGTKQLDEDGLFDLIKRLPGKKSKFDVESKPVEKLSSHAKSPSSTITTESKYFKKEEIKVDIKNEKKEAAIAQNDSQSQRSNHSQSLSQSQPFSQSQPLSQSQGNKNVEELLWVDKYKPKAMKNIIGQQGDKSNAKKLLKWLQHWNKNNQKGKEKPKGKGGFFAGKEDGSIFKCALLSGPPGVGKTTSASLVCKEAGFSFVELNASDTRSKKTLQQVVSELLSNNTVDSVLKGKKESLGNHALVMDEVDGMAGNEDRGGIQELISLIKNTKIPIICMCNDRNHPKIRSLSNYCFDLRFYKPKVDQIKGFAMTVSCREGLKIPPPVMEQIVIGANQDIRQVLHNLQMWTSTKKSMTFDEAKEEAKNSEKNIKIGPFDIVKKLFSASEKLSIHDKTDLFFNDYSFVPLFVQENYLISNPAQSRGNMRKTLELTSKAADAIADSNLIEKLIRGEQNWSLLPLQGFFSCVYAPDMMRGGLQQRIEFPKWLGKNSSQGKHDRILQELKTHMRLSCLANKSDINLDYLWLLRKCLVSPLVESNDDANSAAKRVIDLMDAYNLTRDDWESFMEIGKWQSQTDITSSIPSKVKAAFTRAYNKGTHITPYANQSIAKKVKRGTANMEDETIEDELEQSDGEDQEDITKDSMIKVKKVTTEKAKPEKSGKRKTKADATTGKKKTKK